MDTSWLQSLAERALPESKKVARLPAAPIFVADPIEITLVDDATIERVHLDFMDIPGATDVITFDHGEIVISVETAQRQGTENGQSLNHEIGLYIIHGLLHLAGYLDKEQTEFAEMERQQSAILAKLV